MNALVPGSDLELFRNANCFKHTHTLRVCTRTIKKFNVYSFYHLCHNFNVCPYALSLGLTLAISIMSQFLQWDKLIKHQSERKNMKLR